MSKKKYDTDDDIRLGKNIFRAMQEERASKEESGRANNVAVFFLAFVWIICFISILLLMLGGPK